MTIQDSSNLVYVYTRDPEIWAAWEKKAIDSQTDYTAKEEGARHSIVVHINHLSRLGLNPIDVIFTLAGYSMLDYDSLSKTIIYTYSEEEYQGWKAELDAAREQYKELKLPVLKALRLNKAAVKFILKKQP